MENHGMPQKDHFAAVYTAGLPQQLIHAHGFLQVQKFKAVVLISFSSLKYESIFLARAK